MLLDQVVFPEASGRVNSLVIERRSRAENELDGRLIRDWFRPTSQRIPGYQHVDKTEPLTWLADAASGVRSDALLNRCNGNLDRIVASVVWSVGNFCSSRLEMRWPRSTPLVGRSPRDEDTGPSTSAGIGPVSKKSLSQRPWKLHANFSRCHFKISASRNLFPMGLLSYVHLPVVPLSCHFDRK
jgi:hypothetical protein